MGMQMKKVDPQSKAYYDFKRQVFLMMEASLDARSGFQPFASHRNAEAAFCFFRRYNEDGLSFTHGVIMSNHVHLLTGPVETREVSEWREKIRKLKGRASYHLKIKGPRTGRLWASSNYDRWVRSDTEFANWVRYIRQNPVKAGLVERPEDYRWLW